MRAYVIAGVLAFQGVVGAGPAGAADAPAQVFHHRFAGLDAIAGRVELKTLQGILALPESVHLVREVSRKLGVDMPTWFGARETAEADASRVLASVVEAMLRAETFTEIRTAGGRVSGWAVAARLGGDAAASLARDLGRALAGALGAEAPAAEAKGWEMKGAGGSVRFRAGDGWVVVGSGTGAFEAVTERFRDGWVESGGGKAAVFWAKGDLGPLASALGGPDQPPGLVDQWPAVELTVEPRGGGLRTTMRMDYARPLGLSAVPWRMPTEVLQDPVVGFTAMRNAGTWLRRLRMFADSKVEEWPDQLFLWSLAGWPLQNYAAAPAAKPGDLLAKVAQPLAITLVSNSVWAGHDFGLRLTNQASRVELLVPGLPSLAPFMEARTGGESGLLVAGLFPLIQGGSPAPDGLLSQVAGRTNLVLYDWETSWHVVTTNPPGQRGPRLETNLFGRPIQLVHLLQWSSAARRLASGEAVVPGGHWVRAATPFLGNTVTEVTQTGPAQLTLVRHSQAGFNSFELLYLLRWMENPGFPGWTDLPPPRPEERIPVPGPVLPPGK